MGNTAFKAVINRGELSIKCFERIGRDASLNDILEFQETQLTWQDYSMKSLASRPEIKRIIDSIHAKEMIQITYSGGSKPGQARTVMPIGIVRSPNGDFLVAMTEGEDIAKRFFLEKITHSAN